MKRAAQCPASTQVPTSFSANKLARNPPTKRLNQNGYVYTARAEGFGHNVGGGPGDTWAGRHMATQRVQLATANPCGKMYRVHLATGRMCGKMRPVHLATHAGCGKMYRVHLAAWAGCGKMHPVHLATIPSPSLQEQTATRS